MAEGSIDINKVNGDVFGTGVEGSGNFITKEFKGNVIIIQAQQHDASELFSKIAAMKTQVRPDDAAGIKGSETPQDNAAMQNGIEEILDILKRSGKSGQFSKQIQAGDLSISRVDLLIKKAMLVKSEAEQTQTNQIHDITKDFDKTARPSLLKEAYAILEEANKLDPTNTEVLLHMAKLLMVLTPDDPSDETILLHRIENLLSSPKNDTERFNLAWAKFTLAAMAKPISIEGIKVARAMFERLGRTEFVEGCDLLLRQGQDTSYTAMKPTSPVPQMPGFQPVGNWHIQVMDAVGSTMFFVIKPDGTFQGQQQVQGFLNFQFIGQWGLNPYNQMLQLQGMINGINPFMLGFIIQGQQNNGYYATGTDGFGYFFTRN